MPEADDRTPQPPQIPESAPPRIVRADELFLGKREVWIELDGARYRLRITRRNKLILQK